MADTIVFSGFQGVTAQAAQTPPVTSGEIGINPQIVAGLPFPPPYAGAPPALGAIPAASPTIFATNVPKPPGPAIGTSSSLGVLSGVICGGFEEQLYDRIHLIPGSFLLGNVLSEESRDFEVWNAFRRVSQTLAVINQIGTVGLTLVEPSSPPLVFPPLASFDYSIIIGTDGPAAIDASYEFDFTIQAPTLLVTGTRVVTFAHCPQRPIREGLEFKTNILEAYGGGEQRIRVRKLPRQQFEYRYLLADQFERAFALNAIAGFHGRPFAIPVFIFLRSLLADAAINDTVIQVDTTNADFRDSTATDPRLIILWRDFNDFEIAQVAQGGIAPGSITLERPLDKAHDAVDTIVMPVQIMLGRDPAEFGRSPTNVTTLAIGWLSEEVADLGDLSSLPTHDGLPVLADLNFMGRTLDEKVTRKYTLFDSGSGSFEAILGRAISELGTVKGFEAKGAADTFTLRKVLYGLNGKQTTFFLPSFRDDFNLITTIGAADLNIEVSPSDYVRFLDTQDPWGDIMIQLKDGTQFFRNVTSAVEAVGPPREILTIDASLGQVVTADDVNFICYLHRARFNSDKIELEHTRIGEISARIPVAGVIQ
ncbi:MAG: hypothetical protein V3T08_10115 [Gemmatimonadota bacterium]